MGGVWGACVVLGDGVCVGKGDEWDLLLKVLEVLVSLCGRWVWFVWDFLDCFPELGGIEWCLWVLCLGIWGFGGE